MRVDLIQSLQESLNFLKMEELRALAGKFSLVEKGKKKEIIDRIVHFFKTGSIAEEPKMPDVSRAQRGKIYPLHPNTLMLKGAYKNDLKTRLFFKSLVGDHFHFTAFGIDWLNDRWMRGARTTYQEFAQMWQAEMAKRKSDPVAPKEEWAYINFTQHLLQIHPKASRKMLVDSWEIERQRHKAIISKILEKDL